MNIGKVAKILERARIDPVGFGAGLSLETLQRLSELSAKIAAAKR